MKTRLLASIVVVVCLQVIATATTAQAFEGPYYKVNAKVLNENEVKSIKGSLINTLVLANATTKIKVICKEMKLAAGAVIDGAPLNTPDTSDVIIELEKCRVENNGEGCEPEGGKITTNTLIGTLGYSEAAPKKGTAVRIRYAPKTGALIAKFKFTGAACKEKEAAIEGSVIAEAWSGEKAVKIEENEAEAFAQQVNFPAATIGTIFIEKKKGEIVEQTASLKMFGSAATLEGRAKLEIAEKELKWGVSAL